MIDGFQLTKSHLQNSSAIYREDREFITSLSLGSNTLNPFQHPHTNSAAAEEGWSAASCVSIEKEGDIEAMCDCFTKETEGLPCSAWCLMPRLHTVPLTSLFSGFSQAGAVLSQRNSSRWQKDVKADPVSAAGISWTRVSPSRKANLYSINTEVCYISRSYLCSSYKLFHLQKSLFSL